MINQNNEYYLLSTETTSLLLHVNEVKKVTCEYYGKKLVSLDEAPSLTKKIINGQGCSLAYGEDHPNLSLNYLNLELSTSGRGDYNSPSLILHDSKTSVFDFRFVKAEVKTPEEIPGLPTPHGAKEELILTLEEPVLKTLAKLHYFVYEKEDVIGRYLEIINTDEEMLEISKAASFELVLPNRDYELVTLYGCWANENNIDRKPVKHIKYVNESLTGSSSNLHNPLFLLREEKKGLSEGVAYGFNLVYSGNHEESVEMDAYENIRIQSGISPFQFRKVLRKGESFVTPMAVLTFSDHGENGVSHAFQSFVNDCVIPEAFKGQDRPIVYNNWEATFMKFNKGKIESLMKKASEMGAELFVLDDGWFGTRDDDSHGLGDWVCNTKKLPGGLKALSDHAKKLGLRFGIWMEPEMVNEHSDLYQAHPDWIIHDSLHTPLQGRHQFTLDLTKKEVQDYVVKSVSDVLNSADISYLKWDYNRPMSDFSNVSGTFFHDYILGLYAVLRRIMTSFPKVLFENCASGGNRFDLGMLSFFAQNWLSDDTDSFQRLSIQSGASLGYPLSVMSNHVAAKTSNQLLRFTSLDSKFDVAAFGVLGYELDLNDLTAVDSRILKSQTEYYKAHRHLLQWGTFTLVEEFGTGNEQIFEVKEGDEAIEGRYEKLQVPTQRTGKLFGEGYEDVSLYIYESRIESISLKKFGHLINFVSPIHLREEGFWVNFLADRKDMQTEQDKGVISGAALTSVGASLGEEWSGTGMNPGTRIQGDFGGRLYYLKKK